MRSKNHAKMKFKLHFLILVSLTAFKIGGTTAKKCWECAEKFELGKDKVPKCEEIKEVTCPNEFFKCLSVTGVDKEGNSMNYKKCIEQDKNPCEKLSNDMNITSCTICDSELCNGGEGLMCYSCDKSYKCGAAKCFDKSFSCFSAQNLQDELPEKVKGCISNSKISAVRRKYEERGISFSVCNRADLCNNLRIARSRSDRVNVCYSINDGNSLVRDECPNYQDIEYSCFTVRGVENEQIVVRKGCIPKNETASKCKEYEAKGFSCSTCDRPACNKESVDKCYHCEGNCFEQGSRTCEGEGPSVVNRFNDEFSCLSLQGKRDGKPYYYKGCIQSYKADSRCSKIEKKGVKILVREACYKDDCNKPGPKCYICDEDFDKESCYARALNCFSESFTCFLAEGKEKGKITKVKGCISKKEAEKTCKNYKQKQFSCTICNEDLCNKKRSGAIRKCYGCDFLNFACTDPKVRMCPDYDDFTCFSAAYTSLNLGLQMKRKYCVLKYTGNKECERYKNETKVYDYCTVCDSNLCNEKSPEPKKSRGNVLTFSLKTFVTILSLTLLY